MEQFNGVAQRAGVEAALVDEGLPLALLGTVLAERVSQRHLGMSGHRLNRGGQRLADNTLWTIARVQMRSDARTLKYVARRAGERLSKRKSIAATAFAPQRTRSTAPSRIGTADRAPWCGALIFGTS